MDRLTNPHSGNGCDVADATEHIISLCRHEARALASEARRQHALGELHNLARAALNRITDAGPVYPWPGVHSLDSEFPWRSYVACHAQADDIIGCGIVRAEANFIAETTDPNRRGQPRLDFVFYRADDSYCRLHPGSRPRNDAQPLFFGCRPHTELPASSSGHATELPASSGGHATEQPASAEHQWSALTGAMSCILLREARQPPWQRTPLVAGHHPRKPDVALRIEVLIPFHANSHSKSRQVATEQHASKTHTAYDADSHSKSRQPATEQHASKTYTAYYAEYRGHGQSKTAFVLKAPGKPFHEMILTLAAKHDPEPQVFRAMPADVTPRILYECDGSHGKTQYHQFVRDPAANKQQCTLGAFMCLLRAALHGLRLSDCAFFNFGVRCNDSAVVIIDAGGYGINSNQQWSKGDINKMIMTKFWRQAEKEQAANPQLKQLWQQHHQLQECLDAAEALWAEQPKLQHATESMHDTADLLAAREESEILQNQSTGAGKLVALVGKYQCNGEWSFAHTRACWKAALRLHAQLGQAQSGIVDELYSRLTTNKSNRDADDATEHVGYEKHPEEHIRNVIGFWIQLRERRKKWQETEPADRSIHETIAQR